jgi:hypothetical protein
MNQAVLRGWKTQTRRVAKPPVRANFLPEDHWKIDGDEPWTAYLDDESGRLLIQCPYGKPGDRLLVQETWRPAFPDFIEYRADGQRIRYAESAETKRITWEGTRWRSPRYMPCWAARTALEIVSVRIERVQKITEDDARAEGVYCYEDAIKSNRAVDNHLNEVCRMTKHIDPLAASTTAVTRFAAIWERINGKRGFGWIVNPWVWAIEFKRVDL